MHLVSQDLFPFQLDCAYFQNVFNTYLSRGWILDVLLHFCHKVGDQDRNKTIHLDPHPCSQILFKPGMCFYSVSLLSDH